MRSAWRFISAWPHGWQHKTEGVESQVAAISGDYTNSVQLKAKLAVLQERAQLKFAALECWQVVARELPAAVTLQRWSFADGQQAGAQRPGGRRGHAEIRGFLRRVAQGQACRTSPFFKTDGNNGDQVSTRSQGNSVTWSLQPGTAETPEAAK